MINHPFWGTPIFGNTHMYVSSQDGKSRWDLFQKAMKRKNHLERLKLESNFKRNKKPTGDICHHVSYWLVTTWRIIPVSNLLGSPPFISHEDRPFGRGRNPQLGDKNDHHGYSQLTSPGMILQDRDPVYSVS